MRLLLVHGMGRTPLSLSGLARFLRQRGYRPERLGYVAAIEGFDRIRTRVRRQLETLAGTGEPYAVIGHSLGGLALRAAMSGLEPAPRLEAARLRFLPSDGSDEPCRFHSYGAQRTSRDARRIGAIRRAGGTGGHLRHVSRKRLRDRS